MGQATSTSVRAPQAEIDAWGRRAKARGLNRNQYLRQQANAGDDRALEALAALLTSWLERPHSIDDAARWLMGLAGPIARGQVKLTDRESLLEMAAIKDAGRKLAFLLDQCAPETEGAHQPIPSILALISDLTKGQAFVGARPAYEAIATFDREMKAGKLAVIREDGALECAPEHVTKFQSLMRQTGGDQDTYTTAPRGATKA